MEGENEDFSTGQDSAGTLAIGDVMSLALLLSYSRITKQDTTRMYIQKEL